MSFFWAWVQYSGIVVGFQFGGASKVRRWAGRPAGHWAGRPAGRRAGRPAGRLARRLAGRPAGGPGGARVVSGAETKKNI